MANRPWTHVENDRRIEAFNAWVRTQAVKKGFRLMSPGHQGFVHTLLRLAFNAGSNWQRRHGDFPAPEQGRSMTSKSAGESSKWGARA